MMSRRLATIAPSIVAASAALISCARNASEARERLGTTESAIAVDPTQVDANTAWKNASVYLHGAGTGCSGTLITPQYILTANHCVTGDSSGGGFGLTSPTITVGTGPTVTGETKFLTDFTCGPACVRSTSPITTVDGTDVALININPPLTAAKLAQLNIRQVHPFDIDASGNQYSLCSPDLSSAFFSGYGGSFPNRLWNIAEAEFNDTEYVASWQYPFTYYHGLEAGDSGGPLFYALVGDDDPNYVCGVADVQDAINPTLNGTSEWSPTNYDNNDAFIRHIAYDGTHWAGECEAIPGAPGNGGAFTVDTDDDGAPDGCDNCVFDYNPDQSDTDGDSIGDVCDNCYKTPNTDQAAHSFDLGTQVDDINADAELALYEQQHGGQAPPNPWSTKANPQPGSSLTQDFPGDACDPAPLTKIFVAGDMSLDDSDTRKYRCTVQHECGGPADSETCLATASNVLQARPFVASGGPYDATTVAIACSCTLTPSDPTGRLCLMAGCSQSDVANEVAVPNFYRMTLVNAESPGHEPLLNYENYLTTRIVGQTLFRGPAPGLVPTVHDGVGAVQGWAWDYWEDLPYLTPIDESNPPSTASNVFSGLIMTWVRAYGTSSPGPTGQVTGGAQSFVRQLYEPITLTETFEPVHAPPCGSPTVPPWTIFRVPGGYIPTVTANANPGFGESYVQLRTPSGGALGAVIARYGQSPVDATSTFTADVLAEAADQTMTTIFGLDLAGADSTPRGVVIETATRTLVDVLGIVGGGIRSTQNPTVGPKSADPATPPVVEVSNRRQEVAFFDDRDASGQLLPRVRVYDFREGTWTLNRLLGPDTLEAPYSVAYLSRDDAYYLVDRGHENGQPVIRIVRVARGYTVQVLASWPETGAFTDYSITAGLEGSLIVTASSLAGHAFARFVPGDLSVTLEALYFGHERIALPAHTDRWATTYAVARSDGSYATKQLTRLAERAHGDRDRRDEEGADIPLPHAGAMF